MRTILLSFTIAFTLFAAKEVYTYDSAGRLTSVTYGDGSKITYTYDKAGNVTASRVDKSAAAPVRAKR